MRQIIHQIMSKLLNKQINMMVNISQNIKRQVTNYTHHKILNTVQQHENIIGILLIHVTVILVMWT